MLTPYEQATNEWLEAKRDEAAATAKRRAAEDRLLSLIGVASNFEGTETAECGGYTIKIASRMNRKVNSEKLQAIAIEKGLSEHLSDLFRWKPEINMAAWKAASPEITNQLLDAITTEPARPSFQIFTKEQSK